jgi:hypothetical protein
MNREDELRAVHERLARRESSLLRRKLDRHISRFQGKASPVGPDAVSPPHAALRVRHFSKVGRWANADWYELLFPPSPRLFVSEGCLITGGDRVWRNMEVT